MRFITAASALLSLEFSRTDTYMRGRLSKVRPHEGKRSRCRRSGLDRSTDDNGDEVSRGSLPYYG